MLRVETMSIPLMREIAKMAGIDGSACRRMVLVLDVAGFPILYTENFLLAEPTRTLKETLKSMNLRPEDFQIHPDTPVEVTADGKINIVGPDPVNTTSIQNEKVVTKDFVPPRHVQENQP